MLDNIVKVEKVSRMYSVYRITFIDGSEMVIFYTQGHIYGLERDRNLMSMSSCASLHELENCWYNITRRYESIA